MVIVGSLMIVAGALAISRAEAPQSEQARLGVFAAR